MILLTIIISCKSVNLTLGEKYSSKKGVRNIEKIFLPNNTYANSFDVVNNDILFKIGLNEESEIIFITTKDLNFKTNGFKIDDEIGKELNKKEKEKIEGWGQFILLDTGWYVGFDDKEIVNENSKIKWFFKFNFKQSKSNAKLKLTNKKF